MPDWKSHLLETDAQIGDLLARTRSVAVVGIKTPESAAPAYYVPEYTQRAGLKIFPVPVYYPEITTLLGEPVYRSLAEIPEPVDLVNLFRRSEDVPKHLDDILAKRPKAIWMQLGIRNDAVAEACARAGIDVVQNKCLMVEMRNHGR